MWCATGSGLAQAPWIAWPFQGRQHCIRSKRSRGVRNRLICKATGSRRDLLAGVLLACSCLLTGLPGKWTALPPSTTRQLCCWLSSSISVPKTNSPVEEQGGLGTCCCGACKPKTGWYDKFFAGVMANGMDTYEEAIAPFKFELLGKARQEGAQRVLEVGIGAAPNLQYLINPTAPEVDGLMVSGVDLNPYMFDYARNTASRVGLPAENLELTVGAAEDLPAEDGSFDTVICTLVLCSVSNVERAVAEMRRVLRPGGAVYFLEHVMASPERRLLRMSQQVLNPLQQLLADGCHLDRNPLPSFQSAAFHGLETKNFDVPGLGPIAPHVAGIAIA